MTKFDKAIVLPAILAACAGVAIAAKSFAAISVINSEMDPNSRWSCHQDGSDSPWTCTNLTDAHIAAIRNVGK